MKKMIVFFAVIIAAVSFAGASNPTSGFSTVSSVKVYGSKWGNSNRGGLIFYLTTMPTTNKVNYFIVRPTDVSVDLFMSQLMEAKARGKQVNVEYTIENTIEGGVVSIEYK